MRERWFGATGRRVPEISVEGELDLDGALVLDDVSDTARLEQAHAEGTPVVVRAASADEVAQRRSRGPRLRRSSSPRRSASCSSST